MRRGNCSINFLLQLEPVLKVKRNKMVKVNKILVSQPKPSSDKSPYFDIEKKYDVEIIFKPFIKVEELTSKEFRQQKK